MRIILFVNSAKTFFWHRKPLADRLVREGHEVIVVCADDGPVERFKSESYRTIILDMSRKGINPFSELLLLRKLYAIFKEVKPDLCHNFTVKCVIYGSIIERLTGCKKIINTITGLGYVFIKGGLIQRFVEILFKIAFKFSSSNVIFQNHDDYTLFVEKKIVSTEKAHLVLGSGVDTDFYWPQAKKTEGLNIVFAGRMLKTKGILELLKASIKLAEEGLIHKLYLAGEIDPMNPDTLAATELEYFQKYDHISFLGNVDDMRELYRMADIACLPSYREGLPKFLLEAMASGLPVITTDTPGCRELIEGNGKLVKVADVQGLRDAIYYFSSNRNILIEMGIKSRLLVEKKYSLQYTLDQILALYN
jgi:glycosyltransferase involved in cell wall biosynthesis